MPVSFRLSDRVKQHRNDQPGCEMTDRFLRNVYRHHKITLKKVVIRRCWRRKNVFKNLKKDKVVFTKMSTRIAEILAEDGEVIQVDESIFSLKTYKKLAQSSVNNNCHDEPMWTP